MEQPFSPNYDGSNGGDLTLISSDGKRFSVHKANLAASSHVFRDMLDLGTKTFVIEGSSPVVKLEETATVLEVVLPYTYSNPVPPFKLEFPFAFSALKALDKYSIWRGIDALRLAFSRLYMMDKIRDPDFATTVFTYLFAAHVEDADLLKAALLQIVDAQPTVEALSDVSSLLSGHFKGDACQHLLIAYMSYQLRVKEIHDDLSRSTELISTGAHSSHCSEPERSKFLRAWVAAGLLSSPSRLEGFVGRVDHGAVTVWCVKGHKAPFSVLLARVQELTLDL